MERSASPEMEYLNRRYKEELLDSDSEEEENGEQE